MKSVLVAISLACLVGGAAMAAPAKPAESKEAAEARRYFRDDLIGDSEIYVEIRKAFPERYATFENEAVAVLIDPNAGGQALQDLINRFESGIRETVGPYRKVAPSDRLLKLAAAQNAAIQALQRGHAKACYELAEDGYLSAQSINEIGTEAVPLMKTFSMIGFTASIAGKSNPETRSPPTEDQYAKLTETFVSLGGDQGWIGAVQSGQITQLTPTARCRFGALYFQALMAQPQDMIVRYMAN